MFGCALFLYFEPRALSIQALKDGTRVVFSMSYVYEHQAKVIML